jgi:hypothetical protein
MGKSDRSSSVPRRSARQSTPSRKKKDSLLADLEDFANNGDDRRAQRRERRAKISSSARKATERKTDGREKAGSPPPPLSLSGGDTDEDLQGKSKRAATPSAKDTGAPAAKKGGTSTAKKGAPKSTKTTVQTKGKHQEQGRKKQPKHDGSSDGGDEGDEGDTPDDASTSSDSESSDEVYVRMKKTKAPKVRRGEKQVREGPIHMANIKAEGWPSIKLAAKFHNSEHKNNKALVGPMKNLVRLGKLLDAADNQDLELVVEIASRWYVGLSMYISTGNVHNLDAYEWDPEASGVATEDRQLQAYRFMSAKNKLAKQTAKLARSTRGSSSRGGRNK